MAALRVRDQHWLCPRKGLVMKRWGKRFLILLLLVVLAAIGRFFYIVHRIDSAIDETVEVEGLTQPVRIIRDRYGIPHIFAQTRTDLAEPADAAVVKKGGRVTSSQPSDGPALLRVQSPRRAPHQATGRRGTTTGARLRTGATTS